MNIKRYLTMTCIYKPAIDDADNEYGMDTYGEQEIIPCYKYDNGATFGRVSFKIGDNEITNSATKSYIVIDDRVKEGDLLDGQTVNAVSTFYKLSGKYTFKLCAVI